MARYSVMGMRRGDEGIVVDGRTGTESEDHPTALGPGEHGGDGIELPDTDLGRRHRCPEAVFILGETSLSVLSLGEVEHGAYHSQGRLVVHTKNPAPVEDDGIGTVGSAPEGCRTSRASRG